MPKTPLTRRGESPKRHFGGCVDRALVRYIGRKYEGAFKLLEDD
jgi:hypothetical protein